MALKSTIYNYFTRTREDMVENAPEQLMVSELPKQNEDSPATILESAASPSLFPGLLVPFFLSSLWSSTNWSITIKSSVLAAVKALTWHFHKLGIKVKLIKSLAQTVLTLDKKLNLLAGRGQASNDGGREPIELCALPGLSGSIQRLWGRRRSHDGSAAMLQHFRLPRLRVAAPLSGVELERAVPTRMRGLQSSGERQAWTRWSAWPRCR
ncbi:hypothetical protein NDU88_007252 [Pleurodeles waltl]|uniref:Uncharacterized protein n=1 Tax=Pleurodeles waltl TaxID=8319 RepID=A0AAV7UPY1_PLEWA|nr:hypothetical protein NDU88_007252 [Pleurodeles waltl]